MDTSTKIRPRNVAMLFKIEATSGTDASPAASDAFPFEADGYSYNAPYKSEASAEANGSMVDGAPLIVGQPAEISIKVRVKGAGAGTTYAAGTKPPHHALLSACGMRGVFSAAVSALAITAGTTTSATLGATYAATAQSYRGMPLQLAAGNSSGRLVHVSDYTAAKVATLTDVFGAALNTSVTAALPANWTYAGTSPKDASARATDQPSGTLYIYEDGIVRKFIGCRGVISDLSGQAARPGFMTFRLMGIYAGWADATVPTVSVPQNAAPVLAMGSTGIDPMFLLNRVELGVSQWALNVGAGLETADDPNTTFGFGIPEIGGRGPMLTCDPLQTLKATRDTIAQIEAGTQYPGVLRFGTVAGNRWSLTLPLLQPAEAGVGSRGQYRSEQLSLACLNPGYDASTRDSEAVICFY